MHLNEYHALAQRTAKQYPSMLGNLNHAALGMATEFLEAYTANDPAHAMEETGDFCWYIPVACQALGFKLGDLVAEFYGVPVEDATANFVEAQINPALWLRGEGAKATGDFISMVKRVAIYEKELTPTMLSDARTDLVKMVQFAAWGATQAEFTFAATLRYNIDKLKARFPGAYSNEAAEGRADKAGLDARVS